MQTRFYEGPKPRIFAHRGASGTAPENTIAAFEKAIDVGADILEMDVHSTSDGHIVVMHDPEVKRTTNGDGFISEHTLEDLKQLDAGYWFTEDDGKTYPFRGKGITVPTLREVAERFPDIPSNIEIKESETPNEKTAYKLLEELSHIELTLLAAEKEMMMGRVRAVAGAMPTNFCDTEAVEFVQRVNQNDWTEYFPPGDALQIPEKFMELPVLTPELIEAAHRLNIEVHIWTVNDEADMQRQLEMGVDGIMTDHPEKLVKVVREMDLRPDLA